MEENLRLFEDMTNGKFEEGTHVLRLKMDMTHPNPNMWDTVAYRIRHMSHPNCGDKWCVYPTYDYTHCIVDSLEHIDYSICTLEFENRRESYYWLLSALNIFRPNVYEFARLNITYTVLSKRRILKLVTEVREKENVYPVTGSSCNSSPVTTLGACDYDSQTIFFSRTFLTYPTCCLRTTGDCPRLGRSSYADHSGLKTSRL